MYLKPLRIKEITHNKHLEITQRVAVPKWDRRDHGELSSSVHYMDMQQQGLGVLLSLSQSHSGASPGQALNWSLSPQWCLGPQQGPRQRQLFAGVTGGDGVLRALPAPTHSLLLTAHSAAPEELQPQPGAGGTWQGRGSGVTTARSRRAVTPKIISSF